MGSHELDRLSTCASNDENHQISPSNGPKIVQLKKMFGKKNRQKRLGFLLLLLLLFLFFLMSDFF